jgi:hypothetical protein
MNPPPSTPVPDVPFVKRNAAQCTELGRRDCVDFGRSSGSRRESGKERSDLRRDRTIASPTSLSRDYWLYQRRLEGVPQDKVVLLGDSVVWGEYVLPNGTLSHFLNEKAGSGERFVNGGVNGLFPLALEGTG